MMNGARAADGSSLPGTRMNPVTPQPDTLAVSTLLAMLVVCVMTVVVHAPGAVGVACFPYMRMSINIPMVLSVFHTPDVSPRTVPLHHVHVLAATLCSTA